MSNALILVSGPTIAEDENLTSKLQKIAQVLRNSQNAAIETILRNQKIDLILVEVLKEAAAELNVIKKVKKQFPDTAVILIDGNRELMAEAFSYGVKDAFRKPYKSSLVVERVKAVLGGLNHTHP